jgi:hypothetical protein
MRTLCFIWAILICSVSFGKSIDFGSVQGTIEQEVNELVLQRVVLDLTGGSFSNFKFYADEILVTSWNIGNPYSTTQTKSTGSQRVYVNYWPRDFWISPGHTQISFNYSNMFPAENFRAEFSGLVGDCGTMTAFGIIAVPEMSGIVLILFAIFLGICFVRTIG